jgi:hypothetical protein
MLLTVVWCRSRSSTAETMTGSVGLMETPLLARMERPRQRQQARTAPPSSDTRLSFGSGEVRIVHETIEARAQGERYGVQRVANCSASESSRFGRGWLGGCSARREADRPLLWRYRPRS